MTKGLVRSLNHRGSLSGKVAPAERVIGRLSEPTVCSKCGAVHRRRTWRRAETVAAVSAAVATTVCPACRQTAAGEGQGRVRLEGTYVRSHADEIRARLEHVAARAAHTQPERRIVSITSTPDGFEVLTTSERLAHRLVTELAKAFQGKAGYAWSDDGMLHATWRRDEPAPPARRRRS